MNPLTAFWIGYGTCLISALFVLAIFHHRREPEQPDFKTSLKSDLTPEDES